MAKKVCSKCGAEVSLLVKGGVCKRCRADVLSLPIRQSIVEIPSDVSAVDDRTLLDALTSNFKIHCSTGFLNDKERENYETTKKFYKERFGKTFPVIQGTRR